MKRIKKFNEFVNEGFFDVDAARSIQFILTGDKSHHEEKRQLETSDNQDSTSYTEVGSAPSFNYNVAGKLSPLGAYQAANLTTGDKYSTAIRTPRVLRDLSEVFQISLHHTDGENKKGEEIIKYVFNKGAGHGVHYAIGRDGQLVKGCPENEAVWATNGLNGNSVAIEIATGGGLALKDGEWIRYGNAIDEYLYPLIIDLGYTFNGARYYLDYTDGQMKSLKEFIDLMIKTYPKIKEGIKGDVYSKVFGIETPQMGGTYKSKKLTKEEAKLPGIYIHAIAPGASHVDCFPSSKLVELLKTYGYTGEVLPSKYVYPSEEPKEEEVVAKVSQKKIDFAKPISKDIYDPILNPNPSSSTYVNKPYIKDIDLGKNLFAKKK
jgi:hypothetical protein